MTKEKIFIILPHQLYEKTTHLKNMHKIYIIEDPYYINPLFHKQKLCLHIASMRFYFNYLKKTFKNVYYITFDLCNYNQFNDNKFEVHMFHPIDYKSFNNWKSNNTTFYDPYNFITSISDLHNYNNTVNNKQRFTHTHFYKWQRIRLNVLLEKNKNPVFESWSFDKENRDKFPKEYKEPTIITYNNEYIDYARDYIKIHFPKSFGELDNMYYPITHKEAKKAITSFIKSKLNKFGNVQDAISNKVIFGNHSVLSSSLNIGLLTPDYIVKRVIKHFESSSYKKEIIPSVEGFIRQIIGWREYMRFIYLFYKKEITNLSYLPLNKTMPRSWYTGSTGIEILDTCINKVKKYAYLHHIERLMIMNNIGMLYQIKYSNMYKWFMTCFIDSYDWVMVPNVLMNYNSLSSDVTFMSRVYIASDNYIKKMSDYGNKEDFKHIHKLYWSFLKRYKSVLKTDYGIASQVKRLE